MMIHAICLKCGTGKIGALAQCPKCAFVPQEIQDKAKSVILSDRCAPLGKLEKIGERIATGKPMKFDEADVHKWADALEAMPKPKKYILGMEQKQWIKLGIAILLGVVFAFCLAGVMLLQ
jgi:hypothetical protein